MSFFAKKSVSPEWTHRGASDEARTRYLHLGKVALYQMSYTRISRDYNIISRLLCQQQFFKFPKIFHSLVFRACQVSRISATRCWPLSG